MSDIKPLEKLSFKEAWENLTKSHDFEILHSDRGLDYWDLERIEAWCHEFYVLGTFHATEKASREK